jgi:hypothetical protein
MAPKNSRLSCSVIRTLPKGWKYSFPPTRDRSPALCDVIPIPLGLAGVQTWVQIRAAADPTMSGSKYSPAAIREVWQKEGKQRWDGRTHGRGHCLLIVDLLALIPGRPTSPNLTFEFWRDQNKIRGRFIGDVVGNGIVVAKLNEEGLPVTE